MKVIFLDKRYEPEIWIQFRENDSWYVYSGFEKGAFYSWEKQYKNGRNIGKLANELKHGGWTVTKR